MHDQSIQVYTGIVPFSTSKSRRSHTYISNYNWDRTFQQNMYDDWE